MGQIEVKRGTIIKSHVEDPSRKFPPYDKYWLVAGIQPASSHIASMVEWVHQLHERAVYISLVGAVPDGATVYPSMGIFIADSRFNRATRTAQLEAEEISTDRVVHMEVISKGILPRGLIFVKA